MKKGVIADLKAFATFNLDGTRGRLSVDLRDFPPSFRIKLDDSPEHRGYFKSWDADNDLPLKFGWSTRPDPRSQFAAESILTLAELRYSLWCGLCEGGREAENAEAQALASAGTLPGQRKGLEG